MISRSILFYWSKGSDTRRNIIRLIGESELKKKPCFMNMIAKKLELSHVAIKKHIDLLIEEGYIKPANPDGKPIFLILTDPGHEIFDEIENDQK